jgi:anaerobic magnesium-protoporphyrin IX monomethyl ester cyclase
MDSLIKQYAPELIYFVTDTFLAVSKKELEEFKEFYQDYRIPFWMNTRPETITPFTARVLSEMNCLRFNIGIEHGNQRFRADVLHRRDSNERIVDAFRYASEFAGAYTCVADTIIGLPTETPELVFDTIELCRQLPDEIHSAGAFIFTPYHGTWLRQLAIQRGYIAPSLICTEASTTTTKSLLNMPRFPSEVIEGFMKTFSFYVKFPKSRWPEIDAARQNSKAGIRKFEKLRFEYANMYLSKQHSIHAEDRSMEC